ncbi:hypothetical protein ACFSTA_08570 [Ornithinibacillus salinisoli]|uniref:Tetratricopeptide repeat protein n=1 Tax=Ornithinibacillus salinisoli TaxID=1848459 RepID=A0ABW4VY57_9BACI
MNKRILLVVCICLFVLMVGCTSSEYKSFIEAGNNSIHEGNYEDALTNYSKAMTEKETEEAETIYEILELMVDGMSLFEQGNFEQSLEAYQGIGELPIEELTVLKKVERDRDKLIAQTEETIETYTRMVELLEQGKDYLKEQE